MRLFTPYKRRRRHQTEPDIVAVTGIAGVLGSVQVVSGGGAGVAIAAGTVPGGHSSHKKKRSHTEDESETDQLAICAKEEDPWALADHIDASSDYLDSQIAGKCVFTESAEDSW